MSLNCSVVFTAGYDDGSKKCPLFEVILSVITTFFKFWLVLLTRTPQAATLGTVGDLPHLPIISLSESAPSGLTLIGIESGVFLPSPLTSALMLVILFSWTTFLFNLASKNMFPFTLYFPFALSVNVIRTLPPPVVAVAEFGVIVAFATISPFSSVRSKLKGFVVACDKSTSFGIVISK